MIIYIFLASLLIMFISLIGGLFSWKFFESFVSKNLHYFTTLALGVFTATFIKMTEHTLDSNLSLKVVLICTVSGVLMLEIIHRLTPNSHHHHGANKENCCATEHKISAKRVLLGDAAHNISDGISLVPAFFVNVHVGIAVAVGIVIHEIVQEISEFFILKEAGYSTKKALIWNFIVSSTILIGVIFALIVNNATEYIAFLIAFANGSIFYIIIRDLLPHSINVVKKNGKFFIHFSLFFIGLIIFIFITSLASHNHNDVSEKNHKLFLNK